MNYVDASEHGNENGTPVRRRRLSVSEFAKDYPRLILNPAPNIHRHHQHGSIDTPDTDSHNEGVLHPLLSYLPFYLTLYNI